MIGMQMQMQGQQMQAWRSMYTNDSAIAFTRMHYDVIPRLYILTCLYISKRVDLVCCCCPCRHVRPAAGADSPRLNPRAAAAIHKTRAVSRSFEMPRRQSVSQSVKRRFGASQPGGPASQIVIKL